MHEISTWDLFGTCWTSEYVYTFCSRRCFGKLDGFPLMLLLHHLYFLLVSNCQIQYKYSSIAQYIFAVHVCFAYLHRTLCLWAQRSAYWDCVMQFSSSVFQIVVVFLYYHLNSSNVILLCFVVTVSSKRAKRNTLSNNRTRWLTGIQFGIYTRMYILVYTTQHRI